MRRQGFGAEMSMRLKFALRLKMKKELQQLEEDIDYGVND